MDDRWRRKFDAWLQRAAGVLVPSRSTRRDLLDAHRVDEARVHVTPLGVDMAAFAPAPPEAVDAVRRKYGIDLPYALFVGGIEPRKNLDALVRAFATTDAGTRLVIAGGPVRWDPKAAERLDAVIARLPNSARARIVRTGYVSDREKVALMSGATMLTYPSLYEGFGFPVLEGFAAGLPVLTSDVSSPEVTGDAAVAWTHATSGRSPQASPSSSTTRTCGRCSGRRAARATGPGKRRPAAPRGPCTRPRGRARVDSRVPRPVVRPRSVGCGSPRARHRRAGSSVLTRRRAARARHRVTVLDRLGRGSSRTSAPRGDPGCVRAR
jgi:hypothetical protein